MSTYPDMVDPLSFSHVATSCLKRRGARLTKPRLAIIALLSSHSTPLSAYDLVALSPPTVSLDHVTVYRTLSLLESDQLIHRVGTTGKFIRCSHLQDAHEPHYMVTCTHCGQVSELPSAPRVEHVVPPTGYQISGYHLSFSGQCPDCRAHAWA
ncbi:transcriptional repressor [bacterium]|nr:transcriptional repressor [bacterium]